MERCNIMHPDIKPRAADKKIIGPAITVKLTAGDIVDCLAVYQVARPGDVIVIDAFGEIETSIWGGLMSGLAHNGGIAGAAATPMKRAFWDSLSVQSRWDPVRPTLPTLAARNP